MVGRDPLKSLAELDKACLSSPFPFLPPTLTNQTLLSLARALPFVHPSASRPRQPGIPAWKRVTTSYFPQDPTLVLFPCRLPLSYGSSLPLFRHFQASLLRPGINRRRTSTVSRFSKTQGFTRHLGIATSRGRSQRRGNRLLSNTRRHGSLNKNQENKHNSPA